MFSNVFLIYITYYFLLVTLTNVNQHVCIWILCKFKWSVIEARICLWQLQLGSKGKKEKSEWYKKHNTALEFAVAKLITSSSPPYCSSSALFISSFVTRSSSNLNLEKKNYQLLSSSHVHTLEYDADCFRPPINTLTLFIGPQLMSISKVGVFGGGHINQKRCLKSSIFN